MTLTAISTRLRLSQSIPARLLNEAGQSIPALLYGTGETLASFAANAAADPIQNATFRAVQDADGSILGWMACRRFHPRTGYRDAFRLFADCATPDAAALLFAASIPGLAALGGRNLICLAGTNAAPALRALLAREFMHAGAVAHPHLPEVLVYVLDLGQ